MTRSAKIAELNLDTLRIREQTKVRMPGTPKKSARLHVRAAEKAGIAVNGAGRRDRDLRLENARANEHGADVKPKKRPHVQITITAEPEI